MMVKFCEAVAIKALNLNEKQISSNTEFNYANFLRKVINC